MNITNITEIGIPYKSGMPIANRLLYTHQEFIDSLKSMCHTVAFSKPFIFCCIALFILLIEEVCQMYMPTSKELFIIPYVNKPFYVFNLYSVLRTLEGVFILSAIIFLFMGANIYSG